MILFNGFIMLALFFNELPNHFCYCPHCTCEGTYCILAKNTQFENMQNKYEKSMNKRIIPDWSECP